MTRKIEVLVDPKDLIGGWSEVYAGADGQPRYRSNNALVGAGTRVTRVSDTPDPPPPELDPLPGEPFDLEFKIMADGTIESVQNRLIPYPYPQPGVFPRMYDMVIGGTTYTFDAATEAAFVFTSGIFTVTIGFWGFVQVSYNSADAAQLPPDGVTTTILTITQHRWSLQDGSRISAPKVSKTISITGATVAIDTTAPTVVSVSPSGTDVSRNSPVSVHLGENVIAGTGNLYIRDVTGAALAETIPIGSATVSGNTITFTPSGFQDFSNQFSVRWDAGVVEDAAGNPIAANTGDTYSWTTTAAPSNAGIWYDEVFAKRDGTGVGPRVTSFTPAATWASGQSGVTNSGTTITVSGAGKTATGVDFTGFKLVVSGANCVIEDCIGDINAAGSGGNTRQWDMSGLNPTVRYCRITNPSRRGGIIALAFNAASGIITDRFNDILDAAGQDPQKGPNLGVTWLAEGNALRGLHLTTGAHIDMVDLRGAASGSSFRRFLIYGDHTAESVPAGGGSGYNNAFRAAASDGHGGRADGVTIEECILVGSDDPGANSVFLGPGDGGTVGLKMYDLLIDLREHNSLMYPGIRCEDWYVRYFDWDASVAAGQIAGITAPIAFPNLAAQPAAVPSAMSAPVISAAPGTIQWLDNARPMNQRSLIDRYDMRYSTDGTSWTTVSDVSRTAGSVAVSAASGYRIQFRAHNGIGDGAWSASSNTVTVAAPSGVHRIGVVEGQSEVERILNSDPAGAPAKPTLLADNRVRYVYHRPGPDPRPLQNKWLVASDTSLSGAMIAFANMLISSGGPLDTWEIGWIVREGRAWSVLMSNSSDWPFARAQEIVSNLSAPPTIQYQSWLSANRTLGNGYARAFENIFLGADNGSPISAPHNVLNNAGTGTAFTAQNLMADLLDPATCTPFIGAHKFDVRQDNDSYSTPAGGAFDTDFTSRDIHRNRTSLEAFFAGPNVGDAQRGVDIMSYLNGYSTGTGWTDHPHPGSKDADGVQRWAMYFAYAVAQAFGLAPDQPEFTSATWTNAKVTISCSAGPLTNVFAHNSESQLDNSQTHYTDAMGFYINGQPATRAEFVGGNIELYYGDGTQNFINTDTIMFAPGGGGASLKVPEDYQNRVYKAFPHVDIGLPIVDLMNVRPLIGFMGRFPNTLSNTVR